MTQYTAIEVQSTDEILIALLSEFDFDAFQEEDTYFIAYIPTSQFNEGIQAEVINLITRYTQDYKIYNVENQNWNAIWESSFQPVIVENFCQIRADFHPPIHGILYDLIINPKMAFGTGHHATTYMMIQHMSAINFTGKKVFDFGCGTGILAILSSKMGAHSIDAIDIEHEAHLNTLENAAINNVGNIRTYEGDLDAMPDDKYNIILANINKNILIKYASPLTSKLKSQGQVLLSGILYEDIHIIIETFENQGLQFIGKSERENWACLQFQLLS
jgi:ribosomal protein L11 methyltransferase